MIDFRTVSSSRIFTNRMLRWLFLVILAVSNGMISSPVLSNEIVSIEEALRNCRARYAAVNDYTCLLHRRDLVNGAFKEHTTVQFKFMKPSRFYMKWPKDKLEAIYADGKYGNKMVIHGGLLFKFMSIAVKPEAALKYNRHTIRESDIGHVLEIVEQNYEKAKLDKEAVIAFDGEEQLSGGPAWRFKAVFPDGRGYYGNIVYFHIDKKLSLPVKITVYGWRNELLEEYYYEDLKVNTGLTEKDFDVNNSQYAFKVGY